MRPNLFDKTAEEAAEILASRYAEVQTEKRAATKKAELSPEASNALLGGALGAGVGGLGALGYNYLRGKKLKLRDAMYGALMGAVPGASLGYLSAPTPDFNKSDKGSGGSDGSGGGGDSKDYNGNKVVGTVGEFGIPVGSFATGFYLPSLLGLNKLQGTPKMHPSEVKYTKELEAHMARPNVSPIGISNSTYQNELRKIQRERDFIHNNLQQAKTLTANNPKYIGPISANKLGVGIRSTSGALATALAYLLSGSFKNPDNSGKSSIPPIISNVTVGGKPL